jgi:thiamine monophosphate synthase
VPCIAHLYDILYKKVIYIAYSALYSTNSKQNKMEKQTAVEWLEEKLSKYCILTISVKADFKKAKEMENERAHEYAEFAIMCDRMGMKILNFDGFIKLE